MEMLLLIAVVVLQIITIFIVRGNKKHKRNNYEFKHSRSHGDKNDRKEGDFRRGGSSSNKKNQHENKGSRPQHAAASAQQSSQVTIDPVEKSLRDINLKLKNAEREQESARKKINDYNGKEGRPQRQERSGNGGANRKNSRDRSFNRGEQRRDNWQEKQNRTDSAEQPVEAASAPEFQNENLHPAVMQPAVETAVSVSESAAQTVHADTAVSSENSEGDFEHGRKFVAKRRHLQENGSAETESAANENSAEAPAAEQVSEDTAAEMKFGRR